MWVMYTETGVGWTGFRGAVNAGDEDKTGWLRYRPEIEKTFENMRQSGAKQAQVQDPLGNAYPVDFTWNRQFVEHGFTMAIRRIESSWQCLHCGATNMCPAMVCACKRPFELRLKNDVWLQSMAAIGPNFTHQTIPVEAYVGYEPFHLNGDMVLESGPAPCWLCVNVKCKKPNSQANVLMCASCGTGSGDVTHDPRLALGGSLYNTALSLACLSKIPSDQTRFSFEAYPGDSFVLDRVTMCLEVDEMARIRYDTLMTWRDEGGGKRSKKQ